MLRRFASISVRIALRLQDQVTILEEELRELDRAYSQRDGRDYHNGTLRGDEEERGKVLDELREKLGDFSMDWILIYIYIYIFIFSFL